MEKMIFESDLQIIHDMPSNIVANTVYVTDDKNFAANRIDEIYSMLVNAYADKGGLIVHSPEELLNKIQLMKFVFNPDKEILAITIYRYFAGGNKLFLGAATKTDQGKDAIQLIIKSDIEPYDNWFWGEVSGPIEHYFKKHNGRPIPKELAGKFLRHKSTVIPSPDPNDPVHYTRQIADLPTPIEKAIYGFKDEAMAKEVMESIDEYEKFRLEVNSMPDKLNESYSDEVLEQALDIVIQINDMHEEFGFNEMLPSWNASLEAAVKYMKNHIASIVDPAKKRQVTSSLEVADILKKEMPLLTINRFKCK